MPAKDKPPRRTPARPGAQPAAAAAGARVQRELPDLPGGDVVRTRSELTQLMEELEDLDPPPRAGIAEEGRLARRAEIQARFFELLAGELPEEERRRSARVACNLLVLVHAAGCVRAGIVLDIGGISTRTRWSSPARSAGSPCRDRQGT